MTVVVGRYRLDARLGQGGMGVVWRAHDELLRRDVAVKQLHVPVGVDDDFQVRQVLREARAAARLRHPGVVAVHDVVVDDGRPMIVMELVDGVSLAALVRKNGPLPEQRVAEIGARVLAALSVAHAQGVVHRDVKPGNILLDGDRVVLTDFGIAAMSSDTTVTESVVGSPEYLAPERVNGLPATAAADLWSLGVTLCTALRGESPFQRSDTQSTLAAVLTYEPPAIPRAPRLWPVLATMLRKDPGQRPTAGAAATALAGIAGVQAESATAATQPVEAAGAPTRNRRALVALLAVLVLVAAGVIWLVVPGAGDNSGDNSGDNAGGGTTSGTNEPSVPAPPGFTWHRGDGFTVAVPEGWFKETSEHDLFWVNDPHAARNLITHIEWWDEGHPRGAHGLLTEFEKGEFTMDFISNYRRIKLVKAAAPPGMTVAELEVTYHVSADGEFDTHELIHAVITATGRTYILTVAAQTDSPAATEQLWQAEQDDLTAIRDSLRITP